MEREGCVGLELGSSKLSRLGVAQGVPRVSRDIEFPGPVMSQLPWVSEGVRGFLSRMDSACLVFTEYHVKDTKPCYLIYPKIRESTPQRSESPGTLGKAS